QDVAVAPALVTRIARLALSAADRVPRRSHRDRDSVRLFDYPERAARRAVESEPHDEPIQGAVVLSRSSGDAGLFRSLDRRGGYAQPDDRRVDGVPICRLESTWCRLLHLEAAQGSGWLVLVGLHHVDCGDLYRHVHQKSGMGWGLA